MLSLFDLDKTLVPFNGEELYPQAIELLKQAAQQGPIAIITNQGGPACRDAGWEFSANFPSYEEVKSRLGRINAQIESLIGQNIGLYACYVYKSKTGQTLLPKALQSYLYQLDIAQAESNDPYVQHDNYVPGPANPGWRKPEPGMLWAAMEDFGSTPENTVMYGDGTDDEGAALAAGVRFVKVDFAG